MTQQPHWLYTDKVRHWLDLGRTKNENTMNLQASWRRDWKKAWSDQRSAVPDQELQQLAYLPLRLEQHRHRRRLHQLQNLYRPCQGGQQISELPTLLVSNPEVGNFEMNHRQDCLPINTLIMPMMTLFACLCLLKLIFYIPKGSVFIRDCTNCVIVVACGQFRTRDCRLPFEKWKWIFCSCWTWKETF